MSATILTDGDHDDSLHERGARAEGLRRKYLELCKKYEHAVEKLRTRVAQEDGGNVLTTWAMHTVIAVAVMQDGEVLLANACWRTLSEPIDGASAFRTLPAKENERHERHDGHDGHDGHVRRYEDLAAVAVTEAARARAGKITPPLLIQREGHEQVLELRFESVQRSPAACSIVAMAHDVTDRVRGQRELDMAREALAHQGRMRAMGELASGVAHDLNNVLGSLTLRVALFKADPAVKAVKQQQNIAAMERLLKDAAARVRCLQDFARRPGGRQIGSIDLSAVIRESIQMVRPEMEEKTSFAGSPIRIEASINAMPYVSGVSGAELRHMFINLLLNARDALPKGGLVQIEAQSGPESAIVTVSDNGTGIPEEHLPRIFEPFFTTKGRLGTGLGLSTAHALMTELGGSIAAANRPEGGAQFTLKFPVMEDRMTPVPRSLPKAASGHRVLLIDDDAEHLTTTKAFIELEDQEVDVASSGPEALDRLRGGARYDLVLCDAGMPELNGWQVAEQVRSILPEAKIYLLTGWGESLVEDENEPRRSLVTGVLSKPVNLNRIRSLLGPRSRA
jgi:signal transduction histidine kinase